MTSFLLDLIGRRRLPPLARDRRRDTGPGVRARTDPEAADARRRRAHLKLFLAGLIAGFAIALAGALLAIRLVIGGGA